MIWSRAWIMSAVCCLALEITTLVHADWSSDDSLKRDDLLGFNLGLGDDLSFSSNYDSSSNLLKEKLKQDDAHQRAAFPIMDAFKEHTLLSADDLREKIENSYSDKDGIREAVEQALDKLHKRKEQEHKKADQAHVPSKPHVVTAKELIDEVVKQEIANHVGHQASSPDQSPTNAVDSDEMKNKLHEKLEEITKIETKLFSLIRDVKGFLLTKKTEQGDSSNDIDNDSVDSLVSKRSEIPVHDTIKKFRDNVTLAENFIRDALKEDFTLNLDDYVDSDTEDKKAAKQGDTRDLLGKEETKKALLTKAVPGEIENIPVSSLEREIDENDSVASDRGIARDALVDSPFSDLDYKKATGKRSRHFIS